MFGLLPVSNLWPLARASAFERTQIRRGAVKGKTDVGAFVYENAIG